MVSSKFHSHPTGGLPRLVTPTCLWSGACLESAYGGNMHAHFSMYAIRGSEKTILIDSGHPVHWKQIEPAIEAFLGDRPLDYVFLTHSELPHCGLVAQWLEKYPGAVAVGNVRDYRLYYPELEGRFRQVKGGDAIDLGDRQLLVLPAVWRDLPDTLWGFDTGDRILFVSDGFAFLHPHEPGQCDAFTSELPPPDLKMIRYFNERALQWTRYMDAHATYEDIDRIMTVLKPAYIAGAHGGVIDTLDATVPLFKQGMALGREKPAEAVPFYAGARMPAATA